MICCLAVGAAVVAAGGIVAAKKRSRGAPSATREEVVDRGVDSLGSVDVREMPRTREGDEARARDGLGDVGR
jgi:hypothetical protein